MEPSEIGSLDWFESASKRISPLGFSDTHSRGWTYPSNKTLSAREDLESLDAAGFWKLPDNSDRTEFEVSCTAKTSREKLGSAKMI
jgi:hypothetical protein